MDISKIFKKQLIHEPLIIAEISCNHNGSKTKFLKLIKSACKNGADLIKIQSYEPEDMLIDQKFTIKKGLWKNKKLWNLYKKTHTPFDWHSEAFRLAKRYNKIIFSSPFSIRGVDLLEKLNCRIYKIASFEITDYKLIKYIASKKKPIIISTGIASFKEINNAIQIIEKFHSKIIILHCVSSYPTKLENINLARINTLKEKFPNFPIGISDHTNNIYSAIAATTYDVIAIEKHLKLNNKDKTMDASFSITPSQLIELKNSTRKIFLSKYKIKPISDQKNIFLRRSVFAIKKIKKNEKLTKNNIDTLRPNIGICASKYFKILNKKSKRTIKVGEPIFRKDIR